MVKITKNALCEIEKEHSKYNQTTDIVLVRSENESIAGSSRVSSVSLEKVIIFSRSITLSVFMDIGFQENQERLKYQIVYILKDLH